jgi:hypothetical protein
MQTPLSIQLTKVADFLDKHRDILSERSIQQVMEIVSMDVAQRPDSLFICPIKHINKSLRIEFKHSKLISAEVI